MLPIPVLAPEKFIHLVFPIWIGIFETAVIKGKSLFQLIILRSLSMTVGSQGRGTGSRSYRGTLLAGLSLRA